jgi:hypothetical protein
MNGKEAITNSKSSNVDAISMGQQGNEAGRESGMVIIT